MDAFIQTKCHYFACRAITVVRKRIALNMRLHMCERLRRLHTRRSTTMMAITQVGRHRACRFRPITWTLIAISLLLSAPSLRTTRLFITCHNHLPILLHLQPIFPVRTTLPPHHLTLPRHLHTLLRRPRLFRHNPHRPIKLRRRPIRLPHHHIL
jgi:hypothetical protein